MFERILVPYDGSSFSKKAVDAAIEISKKFDSILYLLTVLDKELPLKLNSTIAVEDPKKLAKYYKESLSPMEIDLRNEVLRCKEQGSFAYYELIKGSAAKTILRFAKKRRISLIVMGSQGLSGVRKIKALGSTSRAVSEKSPCQVMLIH